MNRLIHRVLVGIGLATLGFVALDVHLDRREAARRAAA